MRSWFYLWLLMQLNTDVLFSQKVFSIQLHEANFEKIDSLHFQSREQIDSIRYLIIKGQYSFGNDTLYLAEIHIDKEEFEWELSERYNSAINVNSDSIDLGIDFHLILLDSSFQYLVNGYNIILNGISYKDPTDRFLALKALRHQRNNLLIDNFPVSFEVKEKNSTEIFVSLYKMINTINVGLVDLNENLIFEGKAFTLKVVN